jgi:hypothetical protein
MPIWGKPRFMAGRMGKPGVAVKAGFRRLFPAFAPLRPPDLAVNRMAGIQLRNS